MNELLQQLSKPFHPSKVEWKPQSISKDKKSALAVAYADPRTYQDRLDEVCGLDWSCTYTPWGDRIVCHLTISGITRSATGEPTMQSERGENAGTVAEAQAFKRACAMFGLGRYLYHLPMSWVDFDGKNFTANGAKKLDTLIANHYQRHSQEDTQPIYATKQQHNGKPPAPQTDRETWDAAEKWAGNGIERDLPESLDDVPATDIHDFSGLLHDTSITLTDAAMRLITALRDKHNQSGGRAMSEKQYGYMAGLVDQVCGKDQHGYIFQAIFGYASNKENRPGWKAKDLIEWLKGDNGEATQTATKEALGTINAVIIEKLKGVPA